MSNATRARQLIRLGWTLLLLLAARTPAAAGVWFVSGLGSDANPCNVPNLPCKTFNAAIQKAAPDDWIYATASPFTGTGPEIVHVDRNLTILGGYDSTFTTRVNFTILNGQHQRRGLVVDQGVDLDISDVAIIWGFGLDGGGAYVEGGLRGTRLLVAQSYAFFGGGIYFNGQVGNDLTLIDTVLFNNQYAAQGGGLFVTGVRPNDPNDPGHVNGSFLFNVTLSNNVSVNSVDEEHGTPPTQGGGMYVQHGALVDVHHITSAENTVWDGRRFTQNDAGIYAADASVVQFENSLVADGCDANVTFFNFQSQGNNIDRGFKCNFAGAQDRFLINPLIYPANVNPGPNSTLTHALAPNSPAIDTALPFFCFNHDQRGIARPQGPFCDVGAYERKLDEQGSISHPGAGPGSVDQCPTLSWDARGRTRPNRCRRSDAALIRTVLAPAFAFHRGHRRGDANDGDDDFDLPSEDDAKG